MADYLKQEFDVEAKLIEGQGGIFDVKVDGELIYSKHQTGQFPDHDEIAQSLRGQ